MKHVFYDVKTRKKVETDIVDKVGYMGKSGERYAVVGMTEDGRKMTAFVKKDLWESIDI